MMHQIALTLGWFIAFLALAAFAIVLLTVLLEHGADRWED